MSELVRISDEGHVRHLVLNRPEKRNAFNAELVLALREAAGAAATTPRCGAWW
jgi:enoyl-CoA hydratase/carnithine racemase